ncbi:MAG: hypothetical protein WC523_04725 [Patescibacteria group bacterium]
MKNGKHVDEHGTIRYYVHNQLHREDGPAIEWAGGSKDWWINDKRHREDGPALEWADGYKEWWINGVEYTKKEFREYKLIEKLSGLK